MRIRPLTPLVALSLLAPAARAERFTWDNLTGAGSILNPANWVGDVAPDPAEAFEATFGALPQGLLAQTVELQQLRDGDAAAPATVRSLRFGTGRPAYTFTVGADRQPGVADLRLAGPVTVEGGAAVEIDEQVTVELTQGEHALTVASGAELHFRGAITGAQASLKKDGLGTLVLGAAPDGNSTFDGGITVAEGTLALDGSSSGGNGAFGSVGSGSLRMGRGTTLLLAPAEGSAALPNVLELHEFPGSTSEAEVTIAVDGSADLSLLGGVVSPGESPVAVVKTGTGRLTLGDKGHFAGGLTVAAGAVEMRADQTVEGLLGAVASEIELALGSTLFVDFAHHARNSSTFPGALRGAGGLRVGGAEDGAWGLVLTNANTYSGGTQIDAGAWLGLGDGGTTGSLLESGLIENHGRLVFHRGPQADELVLSGVISGSGQVENRGGRIEFAASNTYSGGTIVHAGGVMIGATVPQPFGSGLITVHEGGTLALRHATLDNDLHLHGGSRLAGHGGLNTVVIGAGVTLAPGFPRADTIGTLRFNDLTLQSGGIYEWNLLDVTTYDQVIINPSNATLHIEATAEKPFELRLITLAAPGQRGAATGFIPNVPVDFTLFDATQSVIDGFSADKFKVVTDDFNVGLAFTDDSFELFLDGNALKLQFTPVPEPSTYALMVLGLAGCAAEAWRRRRQRGTKAPETGGRS